VNKTGIVLDQFRREMLPELEAELKQAVKKASGPGLEGLLAMLEYHLGWAGEGAGPQVSGKRVRPLLTLLSTAACGGNWEIALPAAAAVELIHNFSLIHDDIEDNSPTRHGRPTLWRMWGIPQAVNAGDCLFTLAHLEIIGLRTNCPPPTTLRAAQLLQETCLKLTQGQYLDLSYESRTDLTQEAYLPMISGKTAALISASTELGALVAGENEERQQYYARFGHWLGVAFQVEDDLLGIWGDMQKMGKSAESDLVSGKKSLPVLYGLGKNGLFKERWDQGPVWPTEVPGLAKELAEEGAFDYTKQMAARYTNEALQALHAANPHGEAGEALEELAQMLLNRQI
jgi:geranylgeranyl diphosphate synthase type I